MVESVGGLEPLFNSHSGLLGSAIYTEPDNTLSLETAAKNAFKTFAADAWDNLVEAFEANWRCLLTFSPNSNQGSLLIALQQLAECELVLEMLLDNRDDAQEARQAFERIFRYESQVFQLHDDGAYNGMAIATALPEVGSVVLIALYD